MRALDGTQGKDAPFLSILIPAYNAERYLAQCLDSVLDQRAAFPLEIIILDDCSSDRTHAIAQTYQAEFPTILRLKRHKHNRGISAARNALIAAAKGDYVWFLDSDDSLIAPALQHWFAIASTLAPDICLCDFQIDDGAAITAFDGPKNILSYDQKALVFGVFASRKMHFWSKIFKRRLWTDAIACPEGKVFEDLATVPWLLLNARSFVYSPQNWVRYRQRAGSIMAKISRSSGFAEQPNADMAGALAGYYDALAAQLGEIDDDTQFVIAHFIAKEFTKICYRLLKARLLQRKWSENRALLTAYRTPMEASSPIYFHELLGHYVKRRQWVRLGLLYVCCAITR